MHFKFVLKLYLTNHACMGGSPMLVIQLWFNFFLIEIMQMVLASNMQE